MSFALLIDIPECVGCGACRSACQQSHGFPEAEIKKLTATNYTCLEEFDGVFIRRMCQHCVSPTCVSVCPVGAFAKMPEGPVTYTAEKCLGCRYCIMACPYDVPKYEWSSTYPRVRKCTMCYEERTSKGNPTACSEACPTGATQFGTKENLLRVATEKLNANPDYVQRIYGMKEAGGSEVLYISKVPFEKLGFRTELGEERLPERTWNVLSKIPDVVITGGVMLYGIWWITHRREEVREFEAARRSEEHSNDGGSPS